MPAQPVLIMAVSRMKGGVCTAGFSTERDEVTGLRWVRPVRQFDTLLPEDLCYASGLLARPFDVLEMELQRPRPDPPHVEDWLADLVHHRPRLLRRLEGERRARLLEEHLDRAPEQVLVEHARSLCLVRPERVWASFYLDGDSGKYEARLGFQLPGEANHPQALSQRGLPATDVRWRALGRSLLGERAGLLDLDHESLYQRLGAEAIYVTVGLSRQYEGEYWPMVVGVHTVPDFEEEVDLGNL